MRLSLIIPTHLRRASVLELVDSIYRQDFPIRDFEVLVVSNLADFELKSDLKKQFGGFQNWRFLCSGRTGVNFSRNHGIEKARGQFLFFLDDDCRLPDKNFLSRLVEKMDQHPEASGVGGPYRLTEHSGACERVYHSLSAAWLKRALHPTIPARTRQLFGGNVCYRREVFQNGLGFDPNIEFGGAETDFNIKLVQSGAILLNFDELAVEHKLSLSLRQLAHKAFNQGLNAELRRRRNLEFPRFEYRETLELLQPRERLLLHLYRFAFDRGRLKAGALEKFSSSWMQTLFFIFLSLTFDLRNIVHGIRSWLGAYEVQEPPRSAVGIPRFYSLWLPQAFSPTCSSCVALRSNVAHSDLSLKEQLARAQAYQYEGVILPCHFLWLEDWINIFETILNLGLKPIFRLPLSRLPENRLQQALALACTGCAYEIIPDEAGHRLKEALSKLDSENEYWITVPLSPSMREAQFYKNLTLENAQRVHWISPLGSGFDGPSGSVISLRRRLRQVWGNLRKRHKGAELQGPRGYNLYDPRIQKGRDLDPLPAVNESTHISDSNPEIAVVIPAYQSADHLPLVLDSLLAQSLAPKSFEILIVDDGSTDATADRVREWLARHQGQVNAKYIFLQRLLPSGERDLQFRAGIARNVGVANSRAPYLSFLDSDLIVPPDYLESLLRELHQADVIQTRRLMLSAEASRRRSPWNAYDPVLDVEKEDSYWENFKATSHWMSLQNYWKYTCTYSLTLSRALFYRAGWFRNSYFRYGLEDTDLGYNLARLGARFHLSSLQVYHLHPTRTEFEFNLNRQERAVTLSISSRIFYYHHLSDAIYNEFGGMILDPNRWAWKWGQMKAASVVTYTRWRHFYLHHAGLILLKPYFFLRYQLQKRFYQFLPEND